jgi:hypothetical protein
VQPLPNDWKQGRRARKADEAGNCEGHDQAELAAGNVGHLRTSATSTNKPMEYVGYSRLTSVVSTATLRRALAQELRKARLAAGLTQELLAAKALVSRRASETTAWHFTGGFM